MMAIYLGHRYYVVSSSDDGVSLHSIGSPALRVEASMDDPDLIFEPSCEDLHLAEAFERGEVGAFEYPMGTHIRPTRKSPELRDDRIERSTSRGQAHLPQLRHNPAGRRITLTPCPQCHGSGRVPRGDKWVPCTFCSGVGRPDGSIEVSGHRAEDVRKVLTAALKEQRHAKRKLKASAVFAASVCVAASGFFVNLMTAGGMSEIKRAPYQAGFLLVAAIISGYLAALFAKD